MRVYIPTKLKADKPGGNRYQTNECRILSNTSFLSPRPMMINVFLCLYYEVFVLWDLLLKKDNDTFKYFDLHKIT